MKKLLILCAVFISTAAFSQTNKEDVDMIQALYGKEKKAIVAEFIELEGAQKDAFWTLYDEYEAKRKDLGKKRYSILESYAKNYATLDDATTSDLIKQISSLGMETDKLIITYHKKLEKAASVKAAAQFFQLEVYFLDIVRITILENIPFIGELK
ncbi:MAG: hypothetical protein HC811_12340 [Flammeovirgaceae bacterium]|nr:hypothetical protein [Flammeovirgaceae bacterium]